MHAKRFRTLISAALAAGVWMSASIPSAQAKIDKKIELDGEDLNSMSSSRVAPQTDRPSMTIIGIDAGEWTAINYLRSKGMMPNIDRLVRGGASGTLESIHPMFTPVVWTTIATGKPPLLHGIRGFRLLNPDNGKKIPVNRTMRRASAIWNLLSSRGLRSLITGWYATWPAEQVKGTIVSDYTWPFKNKDEAETLVEEKIGLDFKDQTYPRSLYHKMKGLFIDKFKKNPVFANRFDISVKDAPYALKHSYAKDLSYFKMYRRLRQQSRYDFTTLYIQGPDLLSHQFWQEFTMMIDGRAKPGSAAWKKADHIVRYYKFVDEMIGVYDKTLRAKNETVMIISDHGFEDKKKPILTKVSDDKFAKQQFWHRKEGILIANGPRIKPGTKIAGATIFDIAPSILGYFGLPVAQDMQGTPQPALCGCAPDNLAKVKSYETQVAKKSDVRESPYDQAILKHLNDFGYIQ